MTGQIVFYSKTGNTAKVAHALSDAIGIRLAEITTRRYRMGALGYMRAGFDSLRQSEPAISIPPGLQSADWLVVGSPIWTSYLSTPIRSFLAQRNPVVPVLGVFTTGGGQGEDTNINIQIADLGVNGAPPPRLALLQSDIESDNGQARIRAFAETIAAVATDLATRRAG